MSYEQIAELLGKSLTALRETEDALIKSKIRALEFENELLRLKECTAWISVKDRLPEPHIVNGVCDVVLVQYAIEIECGSQFQTCNTFYLNKHPEKFTCWMYIPEPLEGN